MCNMHIKIKSCFSKLNNEITQFLSFKTRPLLQNPWHITHMESDFLFTYLKVLLKCTLYLKIRMKSVDFFFSPMRSWTIGNIH